MSATWHPVVNAQPTEWVLAASTGQPPYGIIRRLEIGDPSKPETFFRAVTWSSASDERELVGYARTLEDAAQLCWDHKCGFEAWRHHLAAKRTDTATMAALKPPAAELVRFYREHRPKTTRR